MLRVPGVQTDCIANRHAGYRRQRHPGVQRLLEQPSAGPRLGGAQMRTLPVTIYYFHRDTHVDWRGINAAAILVTLPVVISTLLVQRYFERGITLGSTKG